MWAFFLFILFSGPLSAQSATGLDAILEIATGKGAVDYSFLRKNMVHLDGKLAEMASANLQAMGNVEKMAHWINAYNLCTLKLVTGHYPVKSLEEIPLSKGSAWRGFEFGGEKLSLNDIETGKLRPMGDPRIHFAISRASKSSPFLLSRLYSAQTLEEDLDQMTRRYLADQVRGARWKTGKAFLGWGDDRKELYLSMIFNWFREDFVAHSGSIVAFIRPYLSEAQASWLEGVDDGNLRFLAYDWSLNSR